MSLLSSPQISWLYYYCIFNGIAQEFTKKNKPSKTAYNNRGLENSYQAQLKEEETIHQLRDPIEIEGQISPPFDKGKEEEGGELVYR